MATEGCAIAVKVEDPNPVTKKTAGSRSWISMKQNGEGTILDVSKHEIMRRVDINARDLRILDPLLSYPSTILGRERVIVLNLEHIKAIITADEVLLRDPEDELVIPVVQELRRRLPEERVYNKCQGEEDEQQGGQNDVETDEEREFPFEFRALEVALEAICSTLDARTTELETDTYPALDELTSKISSHNLDRVRKLKSAMTRLTNRVQKVRDEIEQLLDDDEDMEDLYLTRKIAGAYSSPVSGSSDPVFHNSPTLCSRISKISRDSVATCNEIDVEELEMLLEALFMQIDGTMNKLTTLHEYIDDTEDYINIQLDSKRNKLIQVSSLLKFQPKAQMLELFLGSGTLCLSVYSLVAAIFGMNIPYVWNKHHGDIFKWVVLLSGVLSGLILLTILVYARQKGLVGS